MWKNLTKTLDLIKHRPGPGGKKQPIDAGLKVPAQTRNMWAFLRAYGPMLYIIYT